MIRAQVWWAASMAVTRFSGAPAASKARAVLLAFAAEPLAESGSLRERGARPALLGAERARHQPFDLGIRQQRTLGDGLSRVRVVDAMRIHADPENVSSVTRAQIRIA